MVEFIASIKRSTSKLVISTAMRATGDGMGRIGGGSPCPAERYVSIASNIKVYIYISLCIHYCIAHKDFNVRFIEGELGCNRSDFYINYCSCKIRSKNKQLR